MWKICNVKSHSPNTWRSLSCWDMGQAIFSHPALPALVTSQLYTQNCCVPSRQNSQLWWSYFLLKCEGNLNVKKHLASKVEFQYKSNHPILQKTSTVMVTVRSSQCSILTIKTKQTKIPQKQRKPKNPPKPQQITTYVQSCENQVRFYQSKNVVQHCVSYTELSSNGANDIFA